MGVSKNRGGPPKSSILIGFSIINHPFWGTTIFGNTHTVYIFSDLPPESLEMGFTAWKHLSRKYGQRHRFFDGLPAGYLVDCFVLKVEKPFWNFQIVHTFQF